MNLLNEYFKLQKQIYNYFGYQENWVVIPLDDNTEAIWYLEGEGSGDSVLWAENMEDFQTGDYYSAYVYTQCFLPKWVYRGEEYTMVCVDTLTDGNKFLMVFNNALELTENPTPEEW